MGRSKKEIAPLKTREQSFIDASHYFSMNHKVILEYCTGFGKTYQALRMIIGSLSHDINEKWAVIVPTHNLIKGWEDEIIKWNIKNIRGSIKIVCYASIHKLKNIDHFCLDEAHNITELRVERLKDIIRVDSKLIGLSATIEFDDIEGVE